MFSHVFEHMMGQKPNAALSAAFQKYLRSVGRWLAESLQLTACEEIAKCEGTDINLVSLWGSFDIGAVNGKDALFTFAAWLMSIVPNTAALEHTFSKMGVPSAEAV
ncbi:hypothetical protein C8Q80DRAFT_1274601 [Daedaleopsis nitida]|nr:hypothetical protein C8Q80DRAFT_1274601 [Daedaleopsis nitida]